MVTLIGLPREVTLWPTATKLPSGEAAIQSPVNAPIAGVTVRRHRNVPSPVYEVTARSVLNAGPDTTATLPVGSTAILVAWPVLVVPASSPPAVHNTCIVGAAMIAAVQMKAATTLAIDALVHC